MDVWHLRESDRDIKCNPQEAVLHTNHRTRKDKKARIIGSKSPLSLS